MDQLCLTYHILGEEIGEIWSVTMARNATVGTLQEKLAERHLCLKPKALIYEHFIATGHEQDLEQFTPHGLQPLPVSRRLFNAFGGSAQKEGVNFIAVPPSYIYQKAEALKLRQAVKIQLEHTRYLTPHDMELNNITAYTLPNGVLSIDKPALPEPARAFHELLTPRMQVKKFDTRLTGQYANVIEQSSALDLNSMFGVLFPNASDRVAFCLISILKEDLKEEFSKHFEEIEDHPMDPKHLRILGSYVAILVRHRGRAPGFASGYSAMAKEVSLTGILADPAIDNICPGYDRDRKTLTAVVDYQRTLVKWEPREDFCVAYGKESARYALLNGETDSTGESELQAMHKMSVISRYSHGIIQQVTGKEDTVILSVYVSEGTCTMYLFYKTQSPTKPFVMQQILRLHDIISHPTHAVGFLRILHNFAAFVQRPDDDDDLPEAQYLKRKIMEDMGRGLPSVSGETRTKRRKADDNNPGNEGGENPPLGAGSHLALKYKTISCDVNNHCIRRVEPTSPVPGTDMETDLIAKWTADTTEVDLIESLQVAKQPRYRNGVIRVTDIMHYETLGTWVIMPRYTPLQSLPQMTPQEYHGLRLHVVEVRDRPIVYIVSSV
ncbi:hypothetical protein FRB94_001408 [Tulasnella sp. JGI-2019a]|nr:hypothetical protein FRB94_001408 [Tulasnella sp. JGI-2019a]